MTAGNPKRSIKAATVAPGWRLEELTAWRGSALEWAGSGKLLVSCRRHIYEAADCFAKPRHFAAIPLPWWQAAATSFRPIQRLLRLMFYNLIPLKNGALVVSFGKRVAVINGGEFHAVSGLRRACRILRGAAPTRMTRGSSSASTSITRTATKSSSFGSTPRPAEAKSPTAFQRARSGMCTEFIEIRTRRICGA